MIRFEYLLAATVLFLALIWASTAIAGGPWSNQYCNLKTETVIVKDAKGNIIKDRLQNQQLESLLPKNQRNLRLNI